MLISSIFFFLLLAVSQVLSARAMRQLTVEQKARVVAISSASNSRMMLAIAPLYGLQMLLIHVAGPSRWLVLAFTVAVFLIAIVFAVIRQRRLGCRNLPATFLRSFGIGLLLVHAGMLGMFSTMTFLSFQLLGR